MSKPTLKGRFLLYIVLGIFIPLIAVVSVSIMSFESYIKKDTSENIQTMASNIRTVIEDSFTDCQNIFRRTANLFRKFKVVNNNLNSFHELLDQHQFFDSIFLLSSEGKLIDGIHKEVDVKSFIGFDLSNRDFFKKVKAEKNFISTSITKSLFDDKPTLIYAIPVGEEYLIAHLNLSEIDRYFRKYLPKASSIYKAMIMDSDGTLIFYSDDYIAVEQRQNFSFFPLIKALGNSDRTIEQNYIYNDEKYIGYVSRIPGTKWILTLYTLEDKAYESVRFLRINVLILLIIFLALLIYFYRNVIKNMILPISFFESKTSKVAKGEYNIELPDFYYQEVSNLSNSFNFMSKAIKQRESELSELNITLEKRIEKATEDIRKQDIVIQEQVKRRSMEQLLIDLAHHWRQPLNVCAIEIQNIEDSLEDKNEVLKCVNSAMNEIQSLSTTITHLTSFYEHGAKEKVSLLKGLTLTKELMSESLKSSGIFIDISSCEDLSIYAKADEWVDVFSVFLYNVRDMANDRKLKDVIIKIETNNTDDFSEIIITDNAGGIDESLLPNKLFEPYATTSFKSRDKGLGLYLANKIINYSLNGTIEATNITNGAKFVIRIPNDRN